MEGSLAAELTRSLIWSLGEGLLARRDAGVLGEAAEAPMGRGVPARRRFGSTTAGEWDVGFRLANLALGRGVSAGLDDLRVFLAGPRSSLNFSRSSAGSSFAIDSFTSSPGPDRLGVVVGRVGLGFGAFEVSATGAGVGSREWRQLEHSLSSQWPTIDLLAWVTC